MEGFIIEIKRSTDSSILLTVEAWRPYPSFERDYYPNTSEGQAQYDKAYQNFEVDLQQFDTLHLGKINFAYPPRAQIERR